MRRTIRKGRLAILLTGAAVLGAGTVAAHEIQYRRQASLLLNQADDLANQKNFGTALQLYQQYLNFRPKDTDAMSKYIAVFESASKGKPREQMSLIDAYERLLLIDNESPRYDERKRLIELYMGYGFFANAKIHLRKLETAEDQSFRNDSKLWEDFAKCEIGENAIKNRDSAIEYLRKAIEAKGKPAKSDTFLDLANMLRYEVKTKASIQDADRIIEELVATRPNEMRARLMRAKYLIGIGQVEKAKVDVDFLRKNGGGGDPDVVLSVANIDIAERKFEQARDLLKGTIEKLEKKDIRFHISLTNVLLELGETKEATEQLKLCVTAIKPGEPMYFLAVDKLIDLGELTPAEEAAKNFAATEDTQPQSDFLRARLALRRNDSAVALSYAEACAKPIARLPGMAARGHLLLAQCHALAGNPELTLTHTTDALRADPTLVTAKVLRAEAHERLGQHQQAADIYKDISASVPAAKPGRAKALLIEQLKREPKLRNWSEFDAEFKGPQTTTELEIIRIESMLARGQSAEAMSAIETRLNQEPKQPTLHTALAEIRANTSSPTAGLSTLDAAVKQCGDLAEFRMVRARLLAMDPGTANPKSIAALGNGIDGYSENDKYRLWLSLGETLAKLKKNKDAAAMFRLAANSKPTDLVSRLYLFDLACEAGEYGNADSIAEEFKSIEGGDGATYLVCKASAALPTLDRKNPAAIIDWRKKIEAVRAKRDGWGRIHACLGDLNDLLGNDDAAVDHYTKAIERGDRNPLLIRKTYFKLTQRKQFEQANHLLTKTAVPTEYARWGAAWSVATKDPRSALSMIDPDSKSPSDQVLRAQLLMLSGKAVEAEPAFRKALSLSDGKNAEIWVAFVRYLVSTRQADPAKRAAAEAEDALKPQLEKDTSGQISLSLGMCREALGDVPAAEQWYRKAIAANRESYQAVSELASLFQRSNRRADAESLLTNALKNNPGDVAKRLFRRQLAISKVSHVNGYQSVQEAITIIDQNINESNQIEDIRAKALILAVDPFRVNEAKQLLIDTSQRFPLTAQENALLAQLYINEREFEKAETALIAATRTTNVQPDYLAILARVQVQLDRMTQAKETVERLKLIAPTNWATITEESRLLAKENKKSQAVEKMLALPQAADAVSAARSVAPLLEEFGCLPEAERLFRRPLDESRDANRHTYLASFYLRQGEALKALQLAESCLSTPGIPQGITARIMTGAIHSRKKTDRDPAWDVSIPKVESLLKTLVEKEPRNPDLRYAEAELADAQGRYDDAIKAYEAAVSLVPGQPVYTNNLCFLLAVHAKDKSSRPLEMINEVINKRGPDATRLDTRAMIHLAAGRADQALKDLELAIQLKPNASYRFHMALAHEKLGNISRRDSALQLALLDKLTKDQLHPTEHADFERLTAPPKKGEGKK